MPGQSQFTFLTFDELSLLISPERVSTTRVYIDCLATMHDIVERIRIAGETRFHPRFLHDISLNRILETCRISMQQAPKSLAENVEANFNNAINLFRDMQHLFHAEGKIQNDFSLDHILEQDSRLADFATSILKQYTMVCIARTHDNGIDSTE